MIAGASALVLAGGAVAWQAEANRRYDEALSGLASSSERVQSQRDELARVIAEHEEALATAGAIADAATADVVDPAALDAFEGAVQVSDQVKAEAGDALAADDDLPDESAPPPFWPWDVLASQDELVHHTRGNADTATGLRELRNGSRPRWRRWMPRRRPSSRPREPRPTGSRRRTPRRGSPTWSRSGRRRMRSPLART